MSSFYVNVALCIIGFIASSISLGTSIFFWRFKNHPLGFSFFINMICQFVVSICILVFAVNNLFNGLDITLVKTALIRSLAFMAVIISSLHLSIQARNIIIKDVESDAD